jgi:hypothetical protein
LVALSGLRDEEVSPRNPVLCQPSSAPYFDVNAGPSFFFSYLDIRSRTAAAFFDDYLIPVSPFASDRHIYIGRSLGTLFITEGTDTVLVADPFCDCGKGKERRTCAGQLRRLRHELIAFWRLLIILLDENAIGTAQFQPDLNAEFAPGQTSRRSRGRSQGSPET